MSRPATTIAAIAAGLALNALAFAPAAAEDWPTRPVTMVVPYAAGGAIDVIGRILSPHLSEILRQQVVIENVGGAGGMVGAHRVAKAAPDGYQFVFGNLGTHAQNQALYKQPLYNAATDFTPVALIAEQPFVLIARKDFPANSLQEFVAYTRANQARMQYGSAGAGSAVHLACALFNAAIGVDVTHVAYRGGGPAMQDLIAGRIDYQCPNASAAIPQIESNMVKAIATMSKHRSSDHAEPRERARAGRQRFRRGKLDCILPAQGYTRCNHPQAERSNRRGHEHACGAGTTAGTRHGGGRARAQVARIPPGIRRERDQEVGRDNQGEWIGDELSNQCNP